MNTQISAMKLFLVTLCASRLAAATALGAELKLASHERGKIDSVDAKSSTLTIEKAHAKGTETFTWNGETVFQQRAHEVGKPQTVRAGDLRPGEHVNIEYYKEGDHLVAKKITISHETHTAGTVTQPNPS